MKDTLYRTSESQIKPFEFDQRVVDVFPDMIRRSVPGYSLTIAMINVIADRYYQAGTTIYDLGCSLGAVIFALDELMQQPAVRIIGVDNSSAMIKACNERLDIHQAQQDIEFIEDDITGVAIENASVVIMNFTLQFVPLEQREALLQKIHDGLQPGGVLVLSEKIAFDNNNEAELMQDLHHHMKSLNGYDDMEIANKREALEKVLLPETLETHMARLQRAGFSEVSQWLRCFNFTSLIAIK